MRKNLFAICVLITAACGDQTSPTGPTEARVAPVPATGRALEIAVDDAIDRLLPGLATDAAGPVGTALRTLAARVHARTTDASAVREALTQTLRTVDELRAPDRADAATLDALHFELDLDQ